MQAASDSMWIMPHDLPAGRVMNASVASGVVLVCEHASSIIPPALNELGLAAGDRLSHAAWDIGALQVARAMSDALSAPLVAATVSRLVYDCNRPPFAESAMPVRTEAIAVPGNVGLSLVDRAARVAEVYMPFVALLADVIKRQTVPPALVTVHTFTPVYHGVSRETEIGLLHDTDSDLAYRMLAVAANHTNLSVVLNEPYGMTDGVTHTLAEHGVAKGLRNVMIEVRNDLVSTEQSATDVGWALAGMVSQALASDVAADGKGH